MQITSLVVEFVEDKREEAKKALLSYKNLTIYGEKDNKFVIVIETKDIGSIESFMKDISKISSITNIIPVYLSNL